MVARIVRPFLVPSSRVEKGYRPWIRPGDEDLVDLTWLPRVVQWLAHWEGLQGQWSSEGANPPVWGMAPLALKVLSEHLPPEGPAPDVGGTWDGGYELSWVDERMFISVLLDPRNGVTCAFSDLRSGIDDSGEFVVDGRDSRLVDLLRAITDRALVEGSVGVTR